MVAINWLEGKMNVIIVNDKSRTKQHTMLNHWHILVMALVGLLILPITLGTISYRIKSLLDHREGTVDIALIAHQQRALQAQRAEIERVRKNAETHLNALAHRLGSMQAQVIRLNTTGGRLSEMAGLDPKEFDFDSEPAMGGPSADAGGEQNAAALMRALTTLDQRLTQQDDKLQALELLMMDRQSKKAVTPSGWPVTYGWVSSRFGVRTDPFTGRPSQHHGVDIASPMGSPVKAMGDGVVSYSGEKRGYGMLVEITHGRGYITRYAHLSATLVKVGDRVSKGQQVAKIGTSGRSTGPHLHFEVLRAQAKVDPYTYLRIPARQSLR